MYINHSSSTLQKNDFNYIRKLSSHNFVGPGNYVLKLQEELKKYLNNWVSSLHPLSSKRPSLLKL